MEKEISNGTMLGIVLIALAVVIGLGFGVFSIARGVANEGVVDVQDNLNAVADSDFEDYDDKIVTGTQVKAAYKNFTGKSVAILVNTQAIQADVKNYPTHTAYVHVIGGKSYINYNAILGQDGAGGTPDTVVGGATGLKINAEGTAGPLTVDATNPAVINTEFGFHISSVDGKVVFDSMTGGFGKPGNCEYINSSAKFQSNLVKDASGTNVGVTFTQLPK